MNDERHATRRGFLGGAALAGALAATSRTDTARAAPGGDRKLRIGAIGVGDYSFWAYSWCDLLAPGDTPYYKDTLGTRIFDMEVTHAWDRDPAAARKFADFMGAEPVDRYDGMVGKVDAVAFGGYYEVPWQHLLARPYIEAGIPTFLNRPFAYSLQDIDGLLDLAARHGTPIMATDVYEHLYDVPTLRGKLPGLGELACAHGTCWGMDYGGHFHIKFMVPKIFGYDVDAVSVLTDDPDRSTWLIGSWLMKGRDGQRPYTVTSAMDRGDLYSLTVCGSRGRETARMPWIDDWNRNLLGEHVSMMVDMQRTFEGHMYEPLDIIRKKTGIFLAGLHSATERSGAFVRVDDLPVSWRGPSPRPDWIDDSMFP